MSNPNYRAVVIEFLNKFHIGFEPDYMNGDVDMLFIDSGDHMVGEFLYFLGCSEVFHDSYEAMEYHRTTSFKYRVWLPQAQCPITLSEFTDYYAAKLRVNLREAEDRVRKLQDQMNIFKEKMES